jgi:hypothetical protein
MIRTHANKTIEAIHAELASLMAEMTFRGNIECFRDNEEVCDFATYGIDVDTVEAYGANAQIFRAAAKLVALHQKAYPTAPLLSEVTTA